MIFTKRHDFYPLFTFNVDVSESNVSLTSFCVTGSRVVLVSDISIELDQKTLKGKPVPT